MLVTLLLTLAIPVFAYLYRAAIAVTESDGTAYTMLPVMVPSNNDWLAANGFMQADALDTRVETLGGLVKPHMVTDNMTIFASLIPATSQTNLYFSTGNSDLVTMDIVMGYGGYFIVADNATLELGDNFSVNMTDTFINGSGLVFSKSNAVAYSDSNNVTFTLSSAINSSYEAGLDTWEKVYAANWRGQTFTLASAAFVTHVDIWGLRLSNGLDSTAYIETVHSDNLTNPTGTILVTDSIASSSWSTGTPAWSAVEVNSYLEAGTYALIWSSPTSDVSNCPQLGRDAGGASYTGGQYIYSADSGSTWTTTSASDLYIRVYTASGGVTTALDNAAHDYAFAADSTNLTLMKDGVSVSSTALSGASVTDDSSNWVFGSDATPYVNSVSISVNGTTVATYAPTSMIIGTNLPNNTTPGSFNGTFVWGANPSGIAVSLGGLVSSGQPSVGSSSSTTPSDRLPESGGSDWFTEPEVGGKLATNPFRPFVLLVSDNTTLTEIQTWRWMGLIVVLLAVAICVKTVPRHLVVACIVAGVFTVILVVLTIWPIWALALLVLYVVGGIISERSPSL